MKNRIPDILQFYRDIYQFEFNTEKIYNFFSKEVTNQFLPANFKVVSQEGYALPVDTVWGREVANILAVSSSEKKLVCGTFFIKGKTRVLGKPRTLLAPLYLHDVHLYEQDEVFMAEIDPETINVNPVVIDYLNDLDPDQSPEYDDLADQLLAPDNPFSFEGLVALEKLLKKNYPSLDPASITRRIQSDEPLADLEVIASSRKKGYNNLLFPDLAFGLAKKPLKTKGIINELTELSTRQHQPESLLHKVFHPVPNQGNTLFAEAEKIIVPVSLSQQQRKIFSSAAGSPLTVVIGPPGTGKSFSIAALAIQAAHEGKRVLIASKNTQACQVIQDKINRDIGVKGISLDASKPRYRISVASTLRHIANGSLHAPIDPVKYHKLRREVMDLKRTINRELEILIDREHEEIKWGEKLTKEGKGMLLRIRKWLISYRHKLKTPLWELHQSLLEKEDRLLNKERTLITHTYRKQISDLLLTGRTSLLKMEKIFQERRGNIKKEIFATIDFGKVLQALPVWICTSGEIANILPLQAGLFDLLIIDEASQCDVASSVPLLYRAKSTIIVGDPNQLRHVSFLSKKRETVLKQKYQIQDLDLNYRKQSVLDLVNRQIDSLDNIIFLDEHFRSPPDIIGFSNQTFYDGRLKVMSPNPFTREYENIVTHRVNGQRNSQGENQVEVEAVVEAITKVVQQEYELSSNISTSIGVISPFRPQVNAIRDLVKDRLPLKAIKKHRILIETPFGFQGEERDEVFLSFTIDKDTHPSIYTYLNRVGVFNVTITRARKKQHVYLSIGALSIPSDSLLRSYLEHNTRPAFAKNAHRQYNALLQEVLDFLQQQDAGTIYTDRIVSGAQVDIVLVQVARTIGIDLVGFPGEYEDQLSMESMHSLRRCQIEVFLLPFSTWHLDREACQEALLAFVLETV
jgi:hypothetical protein